MTRGAPGTPCSPDQRLWRERKQVFLRRILEDTDIGYIDRRILPLLHKLNRRPRLYTTSSCSGRIIILDSNYPWERDEDNVVFKTHEPITPQVLEKALAIKPYRRLWLQATGPILHAMALDLEEAIALLEMARKSGFKHSGIMGCSSRGILIELVSGVQVTIPFKDSNTLYIGREELPALASLLNNMLEEGWRRIRRLEALLEGENSGAEEAEGGQTRGNSAFGKP